MPAPPAAARTVPASNGGFRSPGLRTSCSSLLRRRTRINPVDPLDERPRDLRVRDEHHGFRDRLAASEIRLTALERRDQVTGQRIVPAAPEAYPAAQDAQAPRAAFRNRAHEPRHRPAM